MFLSFFFGRLHHLWYQKPSTPDYFDDEVCFFFVHPADMCFVDVFSEFSGESSVCFASVHFPVFPELVESGVSFPSRDPCWFVRWVSEGASVLMGSDVCVAGFAAPEELFFERGSAYAFSIDVYSPRPFCAFLAVRAAWSFYFWHIGGSSKVYHFSTRNSILPPSIAMWTHSS